jgi:large subunit ribosomal protein L1
VKSANPRSGTGKKIRVCVFAEGEQADEARAAGADVVGGAELIAEIKSMGVGAIDFDKAIAHPAIMPKLSAIARVLGPRGMMPNPKVGTLTADITGAVKAMRLGRVEFRAEKNAIVHACVGKADFDDEKLVENVAAFMAVIMDMRPKVGGGVRYKQVESSCPPITLATPGLATQPAPFGD